MTEEFFDWGSQRTYTLTFEKGDEVLKRLADFAAGKRLGSCHLTGIGSFGYAVLGLYDWEKKDYTRIPVEEQVEVLSLVGDLKPGDEGTQMKVHVTLSTPDGAISSGELLEGYVRPTLEVVVVESDEAASPGDTEGLAVA